MERTSSAKLDEMLNFQKSASDKIGLRYDHSLSSCSTSSNALNRVIFVPPTNNDKFKVTNPKTENVSEDKSDKGKSILEAPPKVGKKESKQNNHHSTNKKSLPKKPHFCHYFGASGHTRPNCYKWLITQQSNSVSSLGNQNQLKLSLAPFEELLKVDILLSNFNGFNSPPYPFEQRFMQKKGSPSRSPIWKEKYSKWFLLFFNLLHGSCCGLSQSSFDALFIFLLSLFCLKLFLINKK